MVKIKNETAQHFNYEAENLAIGLFCPTTLALIFQLKLPYLPFGELKKKMPENLTFLVQQQWHPVGSKITPKFFISSVEG